MKLYLPGMFRWNAPMTLTDARGRVRYHLSGDAYAPVKRLHITDLAGREAVYSRQVIPALFPAWELEVYGRPVGTLVRDMTARVPCCGLAALGWEISQDPETERWEVRSGEGTVASLWTEPDRTCLDLGERVTELPALGALLTADLGIAPRRYRLR